MTALLLWLLGPTFLVHAISVGTSLGQYKGDDPAKPGICSTGFAPAWMCGISGVGGVDLFLEKITGFILTIAASVGVCVFIYACIQMVMSQGQEDKLAAAKKMAMIALVGVFLALSANVIISALWAPSPPAPTVGPPAPPPPSILRTIFGS